MKGYQLKYKKEFAEGFISMIDQLLLTPIEEDDDKLLMASLVEVRQRLQQKLGNPQEEYTITFTPAQSIALRILYTDYVSNPTSYMGNKLFTISEEVKKQF